MGPMQTLIYNGAHQMTNVFVENIFFATLAPLRFYSDFSPRPLRLCGEYPMSEISFAPMALIG
jgi:hypothetical protein